jgi:hypothetical protein
MVCKKCGWWDRICHCSSNGGFPGVITDEWVTKGEWEHIDPTQPHMRFSSKQELFRECEKRNLMPKAFMKPRSQGKGNELKRRYR